MAQQQGWRRRDWVRHGAAACGLAAGWPVAALAASPASGGDGLVVWINADKGWRGLQKAAALFSRTRGVNVQVKTFDGAVGKFEEAMKAGRGPDIWIWAHDRLGDWVRQGWLAPLVPSDELRSDIVRVGWDAFTLNNKVWGYPLSVEAVTLVWNRKLVKAPPKSFEEILALQAQLKPKGIRALGWETGSAYYSWPLMAAGGGYVFQRRIDGSYDGRDTGVAQPGALRGAEYLQKAIQAGMIPEGGLSYADAEADMQDGKQAMWITGPWGWDGLKAQKIDFGVAPLPTLAGQPARPFVGVMGAMVTASSRQKALAQEFIEKVLARPVGLQMLNDDKPLGVPASKQMFWSLYSDERIRVSMDAIYAGRPMPSNPEMNRFWQHLTHALQEINGGAPVKESLDLAAAAIREPGAVALRKP